MDRAFYWKVGLIVALIIGACWLLVPSYHYFKLPPEERNSVEKLEENIPSWAPSAKTRLNLGLDLQGGIHLVLGVDTNTALRNKANRLGDQLVRFAADKKIEGIKAEGDGQRVKVTAPSVEERQKFQALVAETFRDMNVLDVDGPVFHLAYRDDQLARLRQDAVDQALKVVTNRVNAWGVTEPIIAKRGNEAIMVQLPGFKDPAKAKELLGRTAQLEFKIVDDSSNYFAEVQNLPETIKLNREGGAPFLSSMGENARKQLEEFIATATPSMPEGREMGVECIPNKTVRNLCDGYRTLLLHSKVELTGDSIIGAEVMQDTNAVGGPKPYVSLEFDAQGAQEFERITGENIQKRMAIVLEQTVSSAPVIQSKIAGGRAQITLGGFRPIQELLADASELATVLKAGALPAPVTIGEERTVGASLGPELIKKGSFAVALGLVLVILFMIAYYKVTGLIADVALALNALFTLAVMAAFNATLTMPGIAGFVLTLGMAVDANVLINERIREEMRHGKTPRAAVEAGYSRAFWAIFDGHITTLISGFVLLQFGSGPVRGFAVMLIIGIAASLFTSIVVTRVIVDWLMLGRGWRNISV